MRIHVRSRAKIERHDMLRGDILRKMLTNSHLLQTEAAEGDGDEGEDTKLHMVSRGLRLVLILYARLKLTELAELTAMSVTTNVTRCTGLMAETMNSHLFTFVDRLLVQGRPLFESSSISDLVR